jgi:mannose-6-phosphate isomerase-like protein (cupin superfamily)
MKLRTCRPVYVIDEEVGEVVVVPPDTPHRFVNSGAGPLRQIAIHVNSRFVTEWLEPDA